MVLQDGLDLLDQELPEEPGPDWTCADCDRSFRTERAFKLHRKRDHGDDRPGL